MNTFTQMAEDWLRRQAKANTQIQEIPPVEGPQDDGWGLWLLERCVYRDRWWGGTAALYLDCACWCADHGLPIPDSRRAFVTELQAEGFQITPDGLVYGLILLEDLEAYERFRDLPSAISASKHT